MPRALLGRAEQVAFRGGPGNAVFAAIVRAEKTARSPSLEDAAKPFRSPPDRLSPRGSVSNTQDGLDVSKENVDFTRLKERMRRTPLQASCPVGRARTFPRGGGVSNARR